MKKATFFLLLQSLCVFFVHAQGGREVDSLLKIYNSGTSDTNRLKALNRLFEINRYSDDEQAKKYLNLAIALAGQTKSAKQLALSFYNKGVYESEHGNFDSSDCYVTKAIQQYKLTGDQLGMSRCEMAYGFNKYDQGRFPQALESFIKAARFLETTSNSKALAGAYIWIGNVYNNGLFKPLEALEYYKRALKIQEKEDDKANLSFTYNNIGNVHYYLKEYERALEYFTKSQIIKEKLGNRKGLSATYNNIGNVYFDLSENEKALDFYKKSLAIRREFGDKKGELTSDVNIGNVYIKLKKYKDAIQFHNEALSLAKSIGDKEGMKESSNGLSVSWDLLGDTKKAFDYFKFCTKINDSITNTDYNEKIVEMQTKYETEKKESENRTLRGENTIKELEISKQKQSNYIKTIVIISIVTLAILAAIVAYLFYNRKRVAQEMKLNAEIARQKEIRTKAIIEAEEKERRRIAQDLHDGVGQILSAAKLNLSSLESSADLKNDVEKEALKNTLSLIDDSVKEVRTVSHNMMPNTLIKLGLASAIKEFITKIGSLPNLKVDLEMVGLDQRLEESVETTLYRAIQEIVNNIIKHSKANKIGIQLIRHESDLSVLIEDNGIGFDVSKISEFEGIGLKNIISRVEFVNGSVNFDSTPGKGTTVVIEVPVD